MVAVDAAPGEELALGGAGQRVVLSAGDAGDYVRLEVLDELRAHDETAVRASFVFDAELGVVVETPSNDTALDIEHERVVRAAGDRCGLGAAGERTDAGWVEGGSVVSLKEAASELGLLAGAPGVDLVLLVKGKDMIQASG